MNRFLRLYEKRWVFLFFLLLGVFFAFHPTILTGFRFMQTDPGDIRFCNYILEHGFRWISGRSNLSEIPGVHSLRNGFWDPGFFFPIRNVLAYSDVFLGAAPLYWIWRWVGISAETSYQLWMMGVVCLDFIGMGLFLRRGLGFQWLPTALGSFIFAFASPRIAQIEHSQLLPHFYLPLALFALCRVAGSKSEDRMEEEIHFTFRRRLRQWNLAWYLLFFLSLVGQLYTGFYLGWLNIFVLGVCGFFAFALPDLRKKIWEIFSRDWLVILGCGAASLVLLYPLLSHYLEASKVVGVRSLVQVKEPKLQSWFYLGGGSWLYFWQDWIRAFQVINSDEQKIGIGFLTLTVSVLGLWWERERIWVRVLLLSFGAIFLTVTRFYKEIFLWPAFFHLIPGATAIRALSRVGLVFLFPAALGIAYFFEKWRPKKAWIAVMVILVCVLEQSRTTTAFDKELWRSRVQAVASRIPKECQAFYFASPEGSDPYVQLDAMWAGLEKGVLTLNGYSGNYPPRWEPLHLSKEEPSIRQVKLREWYDRWIRVNALERDGTCWVE